MNRNHHRWPLKAQNRALVHLASDSRVANFAWSRRFLVLPSCHFKAVKTEKLKTENRMMSPTARGKFNDGYIGLNVCVILIFHVGLRHSVHLLFADADNCR